MTNRPEALDARLRRLEVRLLGPFELTCQGRPPAGFPTRKSRALFAMLAVRRRRTHCRDELAECFWPDSGPTQSRAALRTELWRVRRTIASCGADPQRFLDDSGGGVRFLPEAPCRLDIEELDRAVTAFPEAGANACQAEQLDSALSLYRGDLLEGEAGEWCLPEREYYRSRFLSGLERLIRHAMSLGDWPRAIECGDRLLAREPLAEHVYGLLMLCHHARGNRPAAIRQFARCAGLLKTELGIEPMGTTQDLYRRILDGSAAIPGADFAAGPGASPDPALLRTARDSLIDAARRLDDALGNASGPRRRRVED